MEGSKCLILNFENDGLQKKVVTVYFDRNCVNSNQGCGSGSGESGTFSVEVEAQKFYRFRFHIGGKNGWRKGVGSAILRRKANRGSINIKK